MIQFADDISTRIPGRPPRVAARARADRALAHSSGFGLVEVMVAMVIALLGIVVMTQVYSLFEGQRRTTTGGDDAITGGAIALYGLQRDLQQSGWGIAATQVIGCNVHLPPQPAGSSLPLAPVRINPKLIDSVTGLDLPGDLITGQDPNTDTLLIISGTSNGTVEGDIIMSYDGAAPKFYGMATPSVFNTGDYVVAIPNSLQPTPCAQTLNRVDAGTAVTLTLTADVVPGSVQGPRLFNLGTALKVRAYAIRGGNLTVCDYWVNDCGLAGNNNNATIWVPIANDIASMRAEYGRDDNAGGMDGVSDVWDQTIPLLGVGSKNTIACSLLRVSGVRVVLVARSSQPEKAPGGVHVTPTVPTWAGGVAINLTSTSPNATWPTWQDFRYKVFQTVVPLRNITSIGVRGEC